MKGQYIRSTESHRRIGVRPAQRVEAEGGAGDVEVEGEVLADGHDVAQVALDGIARVEPLRAIAGPQRLHGLARLAHGEGRVGAEAQLGRKVRDLVALRAGLKLDGRLAQEIARGVD